MMHGSAYVYACETFSVSTGHTGFNTTSGLCTLKKKLFLLNNANLNVLHLCASATQSFVQFSVVIAATLRNGNSIVRKGDVSIAACFIDIIQCWSVRNRKKQICNHRGWNMLLDFVCTVRISFAWSTFSLLSNIAAGLSTFLKFYWNIMSCSIVSENARVELSKTHVWIIRVIH